jgi:hypothetical protein
MKSIGTFLTFFIANVSKTCGANIIVLIVFQKCIRRFYEQFMNARKLGRGHDGRKYITITDKN